MGDYAYSIGMPRNVTDEYKGKLMDEICSSLDRKRTPLVNICMNLTGDFNKASVIRASNAFVAREVWIVGKRHFDRRGCVGTHHFEHVIFKEDLEGADGLAGLIEQGYTIFGVDNVPEYRPTPLYDVALPEKSAFLYGEEMRGLDPDIIARCNGGVLYIPQYGSVRSLNVAQAAAVTMYEYARQHNRKKES
jgi:tRNA G18 (ribose-2'-O)-methylase SpoU